MSAAKFSRLILVLSLMTAAACGGSGTTDSGPVAEDPARPAPAAEQVNPRPATAEMPPELLGHWILVAVDGAPVENIGNTPFVEFLEDGTIGGMSGINQFNSQVIVDEGGMSFGPAAATKMAGPPEAMALEQTFMTRLGAVSSFEVDGETLRLWAGDNEALTFERNQP